MKNWIVIFILVSIWGCKKYSESGETQHVLSYPDSVLSSTLKVKAHNIEYKNPDSAVKLHSKRIEIYKKYGMFRRIANTYKTIANIYLFNSHDSIKGKKYVDSIWFLVSQKGNADLLYLAYQSLGDYYTSFGDNSTAINQYFKALSLFKENIDSSNLNLIYASLAELNYKQKNYAIAFKYYQPLINEADNSLGNSLPSFRIVNYINAYRYATKQPNKDSLLTIVFLTKAKFLAEQKDIPQFYPVIYTNFSSYYGKKGKHDSSIYYARKAIDYMKVNKSAINYFEKPYIDLVSGYYNSKQYEEAKYYLNELGNKVDITTIGIEDRIYYYKLLYSIRLHYNQYHESLSALEKLDSLKDVLHDIEKNEQLDKFNLEFKKLNNDKQIENINRQIAEQKMYTKILIILSIILVILGAFIYLYLINKRKLETETKLNDERNRIAQEMHDDLGTTLTTTLMAVEMLKQLPKEQTALNMVSNAADELYKQINDIIWNLNVNNDNIRNLFSYLIRFGKKFCKETELTFVYVESADHYSKIIEGYRRRVVFLAVKELLNNVAKHALATKVELLLRYEKGIMTIILIDDGIGYNQAKSNNSDRNNGYGMSNIQNNVTKLGGSVLWSNGNNKKGTMVEIQLKIK